MNAWPHSTDNIQSIFKNAYIFINFNNSNLFYTRNLYEQYGGSFVCVFVLLFSLTSGWPIDVICLANALLLLLLLLLQRSTLDDVRPKESAAVRRAVVESIGQRIGRRLVVIVIAGRVHHKLETRQFSREILVET